jgi:hypothetical protein
LLLPQKFLAAGNIIEHQAGHRAEKIQLLLEAEIVPLT